MPNIFKQLIFILNIYSCLILHGQFQLNQISHIKGVSQNTINSIIQDKDGFLWIATYNGINKYDGYSMDHYNFSNNNLSSNLIHNLFEDKDGNIWAGTSESGINRIDPNTKKIVTFFNNPKTAGDFKNTPDTDFKLHQSDSGIYFYESPKGDYDFFSISDGDTIVNYKKNEEWKSGVNSKNMVKASLNRKHWFFNSGQGVKLCQVNITNVIY